MLTVKPASMARRYCGYLRHESNQIHVRIRSPKSFNRKIAGMDKWEKIGFASMVTAWLLWNVWSVQCVNHVVPASRRNRNAKLRYKPEWRSSLEEVDDNESTEGTHGGEDRHSQDGGFADQDFVLERGSFKLCGSFRVGQDEAFNEFALGDA